MNALGRGAIAGSSVALLALIPLVASATPFTGIFDPALTTVATTTAPFLQNSMNLATDLFRIVMVVSFMVAIARYAIMNQTIEGSGHVIMNMFVTMVPLLVVIDQSPYFLSQLVNWAQTLAGAIAPGQTAYLPDEIIERGWGFCGLILHTASAPFSTQGVQLLGKALTGDEQIFFDVAGIFVAFFASIVIMLSFCLIAVQLFLATIQTYFAVAIGAISLGWMSGSATKGMADSYIGGCWKSVLHLVTVIVSVAFVMGLVGPMDAFASNPNPSELFGNILKLMSAAVMAALISWKLPDYASNMFTGSPATGALEAIFAAKGAAGAAHGTAKGAVRGAKATYAGGKFIAGKIKSGFTKKEGA